MGVVLASLGGRLHTPITLTALFLVLSSPWVSLYRAFPNEPGLVDYAHAGLGLLAFAMGLLYLADCVRGGAWRVHFPWLTPGVRTVLNELGGLLRGHRPAAESGGLLGTLSGLTLLALVATGVTGVGWWWLTGTSAALDWRSIHLVCARVFIGLLILHVVSVSLHVLDFLRD